MARLAIAILLSFAAASYVLAQTPNPRALICPSDVPSEVAEITCRNDNQCQDGLKCCSTRFRGSVCVAGVPPQTRKKPLDCPPAVTSDITKMTCTNDSQCKDDLKCCRTSSRGTICVPGVTPRPNNRLKRGKCPEKPTGVYFCTSTCTVDGDCPRRNKCCKNRCGALACTKPEL